MNNLNIIIQNPMIFIFWIISLIFRSFPPKNINGIYGYRTSRSMKNIDSWNFAQKNIGNICLKISTFLLIIQIYLIYTIKNYSDYDIILVISYLLIMIINIFLVENKLKKIQS